VVLVSLKKLPLAPLARAVKVTFVPDTRTGLPGERGPGARRTGKRDAPKRGNREGRQRDPGRAVVGG